MTVTSTADDGSAGTLRSALKQANSASGPETIKFSSLFDTPQTIRLSGDLGTLALKNAYGITIDGPAAGLTISGSGSGGTYGQVISTYPQADSTISNVTITGGAGNKGGAIYHLGGTTNLNNCTILDNTAGGYGGGLYISGGFVTLTNCTFADNNAGSGGYGGAIYSFAAVLSLVNCTVSGNTAAFGGGVYNADTAAVNSVTLLGTIVAGNKATDAHGGPDLWANTERSEITSAGYNLIGSNPDGAIITSNSQDIINKDPKLSPPGDYGGPTPTMALLPGSPAIHMGSEGVDLPVTDQRGFPLDITPDIGAFQVQPDPLLVNTTSDEITSPAGQMNLRQAVNLANVLKSATTINFAQSPGDAFATPQTISLTEGQLELSDTSGLQTITGPNANLTLSGSGLSRVFQVDGGVTASIFGLFIANGGGSADKGGGVLNLAGANLTLLNCTLTGNTAHGNGGGLANYGSLALTDSGVAMNNAGLAGGGVYSKGPAITVTNCVITGNTANTNAGGLFTFPMGEAATLTGCDIENNTAGSYGGGFENYTGAASLTNCTISGNTASQAGGGLVNPAPSVVMLSSCTISGNMAGTSGRALANTGTMTFTNCTISGNTATKNGGGLLNLAGDLTLTNCTVSGNTAKDNEGGGLLNSGTAKLSNTIDAGNSASAGPNADGPVLSEGYNLIGITDGSSGWVKTDLTGTAANPLNPLLAPLENYRSPMQTLALLPGSPAIDAGKSSVSTDERGVNRPKGAVSDIGAFESNGFTIAVTSGGGQSANITEPFASPLIVKVTANDPDEPVAGGEVTFRGPASGASATVNPKAATIGSDGTAASTMPTANVAPGTYTLIATAAGVTVPATFSLTNLASLVVNSTSDAAYTAPGVNTLRLAIIYANTLTTGTPTISFDPAAFQVPETIQLGSALPDLSNTAVLIDISGPGASRLSLQGGGASSNYRAIAIDAGVQAIISDLTITNFAVQGDGGGIDDNGAVLTISSVTFAANSAANGGGFFNSGTATIEGALFTDNHATSGGGIDNQHDLTVFGTTLAGNSATGQGGGLYFSTGTSLDVVSCTLQDNTASEGAGAWLDASSPGEATLGNCTFSGNAAATSGGGLSNHGMAELTNCTLSSNTAGSGGGAGIYNVSALSLDSCTVSKNSGGTLGGAGLFDTGGTATLFDTIVAGNTNDTHNPNDIGGGISVSPASTFNLVGPGGSGDMPTGSGTGNIVLTSLAGLGLAPLGSYGGPTATMALLPGSPAIGAGSPGGELATDQRNEPRTGHIDIGAFQSQGFLLIPSSASTPQTAVIGNKFANPLSLTVKANNPIEPVDGGVVSFAVPSKGASAVLSGDISTISGDTASVIATANSWIGNYAVTVSASGAPSAGFALTNLESQSTEVTTASDVVNGLDGLTSLREAIAFANSEPGPHTITLDPAVFGKSAQTIALTGGPLLISNPAPITIRGPGAKRLTIRGAGNGPVFDVAGGALSLSGVTVTGGRSEMGGGVVNTGTLKLAHVAVRHNFALIGGGLFNAATATLRDVTFARDGAVEGGAMANFGSLSTKHVTMRNDSARVARGLFSGRHAKFTRGLRPRSVVHGRLSIDR